MFGTLIAKFGAPFFIGLVLGGAGIIGLNHLNKQDIKLECPPPIVNLKCPDPVNTIDFDKVKGFKGNLTVNQNYRMELKSDSLVTVAIRKEFLPEIQKMLSAMKIAKCK
jgi:hypothetical protein